jgi:hypothetical protein
VAFRDKDIEVFMRLAALRCGKACLTDRGTFLMEAMPPQLVASEAASKIKS